MLKREEPIKYTVQGRTRSGEKQCDSRSWNISDQSEFCWIRDDKKA